MDSDNSRNGDLGRVLFPLQAVHIYIIYLVSTKLLPHNKLVLVSLTKAHRELLCLNGHADCENHEPAAHSLGIHFGSR